MNIIGNMNGIPNDDNKFETTKVQIMEIIKQCVNNYKNNDNQL